MTADELRRQGVPGKLVPVYFTHGDRRLLGEHGEISLGKAYLVSRLQALLLGGRLHLPKTAEAEVLAQELLDYEIRVDQDANDKDGAFRVGTHDDLMTAVGLATQIDPRPFVAVVDIPKRAPIGEKWQHQSPVGISTARRRW